MPPLRTIFSEYRGGISLTYGLTAVENLFDLLYPFAIGLAINGLLTQQWLMTAPLPLIWLAHTGSGYLRQRFDTRLFTRIYTQIASSTVLQQRQAQESVSGIAARTDMVEELVEFLESDVPAILLALFAVIGGAAMLFVYDAVAGLLMSLLIPLAAWVYLRFGVRAFRMEEHFNDRSEREVDLIAHAGAAMLRRHFRNLSRWRVRISDAEARAWSSIELVAMLLFGAVLVRLTSIDGLMAGDIFAAVAYCVRMLDALDTVPDRVAQSSRLLENLRRLD